VSRTWLDRNGSATIAARRSAAPTAPQDERRDDPDERRAPSGEERADVQDEGEGEGPRSPVDREAGVEEEAEEGGQPPVQRGVEEDRGHDRQLTALLGGRREPEGAAHRLRGDELGEADGRHGEPYPEHDEQGAAELVAIEAQDGDQVEERDALRE
jgi:hypothetical protein